MMNSLLDKNRTWEVELAKLLTVKNVTVQINEAVDQHQHYKIHTIGKYQSLFSLTYVSNIAQLWFARKVERRILDCSEYLSTNVNTKLHRTENLQKKLVKWRQIKACQIKSCQIEKLQ